MSLDFSGLITDRTNADYQDWLALSKIPWNSMTAAQKAAWSVPLKGAYNSTDLDRVGTALLNLQTLLKNEYGRSIAVYVRTNWGVGEWPTRAEMDSYAISVQNMRAAFDCDPLTPPAPPNMEDGTITIWNNIEQILFDVNEAIKRLDVSLIYSGEIYCGEF